MGLTKHRLPMSAPMIRAIRREIERPGTGKTQTRRIANPQPTSDDIDNVGDCETIIDMATGRHITSPYGGPGDLLAFTETFAFGTGYDELPPRDVPECPYIGVWYRAGEDVLACEGNRGRWRPARFMPYWCSRYTGLVTDVRLERVQEISDQDAKAEGCYEIDDPGTQLTERGMFRHLWDSLHGPDAWFRNDWVWVYTFRLIPVNVLEVERDPVTLGLEEAS